MRQEGDMGPGNLCRLSEARGVCVYTVAQAITCHMPEKPLSDTAKPITATVSKVSPAREGALAPLSSEKELDP